MAGEARVHFVGRLGGDPELRFTPSGAAVASMSVAVQGRKKNGDRWEDGETTWFRVIVWRDYAENVAESLRKGDRVVVDGTLEMRSYETRDGGKGQSLEVQAETVTPDLRFASATVNRVERGGPGAQGGGDWGNQGYGQQRPQGGGGQYGGQQRGGAPADDPWGQPPQQGGWSGGNPGVGGGYDSEPPF